MGPKMVLIKRGEYGVWSSPILGDFRHAGLSFGRSFDPTGAGDSFAGGLMGHLARTATRARAACAAPSCTVRVVASFTVEDFGVKRLTDVRCRKSKSATNVSSS